MDNFNYTAIQVQYLITHTKQQDVRMEHHGQDFIFPLLIVTLLAFIVPIATSWISRIIRLPVPAIVGEILCGIIIGKSVLGIIPRTDTIPWLEFLSLFGFTYLMFLSGLEIDFALLRPKKSNFKSAFPLSQTFFQQPLAMAITYFILVFALGTIFSYYLYSEGYINSWIFMALVLSTVSVGIVVPIVKEKNLSKTTFGQNILLCALIADFLTMIFITAIAAIYTGHTELQSIGYK